MNRRKKHILILVVSFIFFLISNFPIIAQLNNNSTLNSPYDCLYNHLYYLQKENYNEKQASLSFKLAKDSLSSIQNAIKTKQILDAKGLFVYMNTIPDQNNFIDSISGNSIYTPFPKKLPSLYLERSDNQWFYSSETNRAIDRLHKKTFPYGTHRLVEYFNNQNQLTILGLAIWQYIAICTLLLLAFLLYKILIIFINMFLKRILPSKIVRNNAALFDKLSHPASILLVLLFLKILIPILQLQVKWSEYLNLGINIGKAVILGFLFIRVIDILMSYLGEIAESTENKLDEQLMPILHRVANVIVFFLTTLYVLNMLNVNITALIAGVSIGGLALALAAQDTVKNLIGSLMIFLDAPFQIGDYIIVNGMEGTVVEVGFRSTRIQTIDSSIITLPNGNLSSVSLTNKGVRKHRLFNTILTLSYQTKAADITAFISGLKDIIFEHPKTEKEGFYVHLNNLNSSSIDILFRVKITTIAYDEELKIKEELLFSIIKLAEKIGVDFAFPSQSIYIEKS